MPADLEDNDLRDEDLDGGDNPPTQEDDPPIQEDIKIPSEEGRLEDGDYDWRGIAHEYIPHDPVLSNIKSILSLPVRDRSSEQLELTEGCSLDPSSDLVLYQGKPWIPLYEPLRTKLMSLAHDTRLSGHGGMHKTSDLLSRSVYWPLMNKDVRNFVSTCDLCQRTKIDRTRRQGHLEPLPTPPRPWASVSMDHITDLPESLGYNRILVIIDRYSKFGIFLPANDTDGAIGTARHANRHVFSVYGYPEVVISDRGGEFNNQFTRDLFRLTGTRVALTSSHRPQGDGQTERTNAVLEEYLRAFCSYQQDDWADLLATAQFAYNNSHHSSIGMTPFFCNNGFHPKTELSPVVTPLPSVSERAQVMKDIHDRAASEFAKARQRMTESYNKHRRGAPDLEPGEQVYLDGRNIRTLRPNKKMDFRRMGPYEVIEKVGTRSQTYRLLLPHSLKIHPVFNIELLTPHRPNTLPSRPEPTPPYPVVIPGREEEFLVSEILDSKLLRRKLRYLVRWEGYSDEYNEWIDAEDLAADNDLVLDFHSSQPNKPGSQRLRLTAEGRQIEGQSSPLGART